MLSRCKWHARAAGPLGVALAFGLAALTAVATGARTPAPAPAPADTVPAPPEFGSTRVNVEKAFDFEMNTKELYVAFARQADLEGQPGVASLFRAAARAEEVHAQRHVEALAWLGGRARAVLGRPVVGTTAENLRLAIDGETYDGTRFYPAMLERARAERQMRAVRGTAFAMAAEREHARLFDAALAGLGRPSARHAYFICPYCGKTVESADFRKCPNCFTARSRFLTVS